MLAPATVYTRYYSHGVTVAVEEYRSAAHLKAMVAMAHFGGSA